MFVVEDRHGAAVGLEDVGHLAEELVPRIEDLAFFVFRVLTVLADDQDAVDRELRSATSQGLGDGRIDLEAEALRTLGALVALGLLVDVERHDVHLGPVPSALWG